MRNRAKLAFVWPTYRRIARSREGLGSGGYPRHRYNGLGADALTVESSVEAKLIHRPNVRFTAVTQRQLLARTCRLRKGRLADVRIVDFLSSGRNSTWIRTLQLMILFFGQKVFS